MIHDTEKRVPTYNQVETSRDSRDLLDRKKNEYRRKIFEEIKRHGGMTCDELEISMELRHQTASCFIRVLTKEGLLRATDERRRTRTGRGAIVWKVVEPPPAGPPVQKNLFEIPKKSINYYD